MFPKCYSQTVRTAFLTAAFGFDRSDFHNSLNFVQVRNKQIFRSSSVASFHFILVGRHFVQHRKQGEYCFIICYYSNTIHGLSNVFAEMITFSVIVFMLF